MNKEADIEIKKLICEQLYKLLDKKYKKEHLFMAVSMLKEEEKIILAKKLNIDVDENELINHVK